MKVNELVFENHKSSKSTTGFRVYYGLLPGNSLSVVGIDPGINLGVTLILNESVSVLYGKLSHEKAPGMSGVAAFDFMGDLLDWKDWEGYRYAIIEGAAYAKYHGQVILEEVREALFLSMYYSGVKSEIVPPATVRKVAFGKGLQQAGDIWPWMNHNAADSLGMALYALEKYA